MGIFSYISGIAGTELTPDERALFRERPPWGVILFARNVADPDQLRALTVQIRQVLRRDDAPILIDQEGGRVQRMRPPHWPEYPPAASSPKSTRMIPIPGCARHGPARG